MWTPGEEEKKPEIDPFFDEPPVIEIKVSEKQLKSIKAPTTATGKVGSFLEETAYTWKQAYVTFILVVANVLIFLYQQLNIKHGLVPVDVIAEGGASSWPTVFGKGQVYRLLTCMFLHGSWSHLIGNMLILFICAAMLEMRISRKRLLLLYFIGGLFASLTSVVLNHFVPMTISYRTFFGDYKMELYDVKSVGASGAIAALLSAVILFLLLWDRNADNVGERMKLPIGSIAVGYLLVNALIGVFSKEVMVDTAAHLGGFLAGIAIILFFAWRDYYGPSWE